MSLKIKAAVQRCNSFQSATPGVYVLRARDADSIDNAGLHTVPHCRRSFDFPRHATKSLQVTNAHNEDRAEMLTSVGLRCEGGPMGLNLPG